MYSDRILWWAIFKKIFIFLLISIFFSTTVYATISSSFSGDSIVKSIQKDEEENYFIVTWYYSPLLDQKEYVTGSYEWDIKLNGKWIHWASGKGVFTWMLAAPKSYEFWTKIYLEWYGVGVVEDRGWAIVEAGERNNEYDRIDIWMGYGDEWRLRAKNWGRRTVKWYVVSNSEKVSIRLKSSIEDSYLYLSLSPDSSEEEIKKVQLFFQEIGKYKWKITGKYNDIKDTIIAYQYQKWLIKDKDDRWAGHFWPKTIQKLKEEYGVALGNKIYLTKTLYLTQAEKEKIDKLKEGVIKKVKAKKYSKEQEQKILQDLVTRLSSLKEKTKDEKLKMKLDYLQSII